MINDTSIPMFKQVFRFSLLLAAAAAGSAHAASFDCRLARTQVEKMICADAAISTLDERMQVLYAQARQAAADKHAELDVQRDWLKLRNICTNPACLRVTYELRIAELQYPGATPDFSGHWTIDLRTPQERQQKRDCGGAAFDLKQTGNRISGNHTFATTGCGRVNEGSEDAVKGTVIGSTAVLLVRSGRNDAVVLGTARRDGKLLHWTMIDEVVPGTPGGDAPLILGKGSLMLQSDAK